MLARVRIPVQFSTKAFAKSARLVYHDGAIVASCVA